MEHIHLHIMSADLVSDHLNNRKHYNSFHPTLGFFLDLDEVLDWYNLPDAEFKKVRQTTSEPSLCISTLVTEGSLTDGP